MYKEGVRRTLKKTPEAAALGFAQVRALSQGYGMLRKAFHWRFDSQKAFPPSGNLDLDKGTMKAVSFQGSTSVSILHQLDPESQPALDNTIAMENSVHTT